MYHFSVRTRARTHARTHQCIQQVIQIMKILFISNISLLAHIRNSVINIKFFTSIKFIQNVFWIFVFNLLHI